MATRTSTPGTPPDSGAADSATAFDPRFLEELFAGDMDSVRDVVSVVLSTCPDQVRRVERAVQTGTPDEVRQAAHAIKGALRQIGAAHAGGLAARIEASADGPRSDQFASVAELRDVVSSLLATLSARYGIRPG